MKDESYVIPDTLLKNLSDSADWYVTITRLMDALRVPDLTTRHGLKKVHTRFNEFYKKLNSTYTVARRENNQRAMGAVVGIMAKMCVDALLRNKLFEKGIVNKIMPLLDVELTRYLALNALVLVTHQVATDARREIAPQNKILIKLVQDHPDDPRLAVGVITILDHVTEAVVGGEDLPSPALVQHAAVQPVLETVVTTLRKFTASTRDLLTHALHLLVCAPLHCPTECRAVPGLIFLLVAFMRSKSINVRAVALCGLQRLAVRDHEHDAPPPPPHRFVEAASRGPPGDLLDILCDYGAQKGDLFIICKCMSEYTQAMMRALQDRDMYALGKKLAYLIQQSEYVIADGTFQGPDGYELSEQDGWPFIRYTDALPLAAKALRETERKADLDDADIVQLKFFIFRKRSPESSSLAQAALKRNPKLSYAYYALSLNDDTLEGLRAVKKGLKCPNTTPFVRDQLRWRGISIAATHGLSILQRAKEGDVAVRPEAWAFLVSAWEDAKTFITEAPPDSRHMLSVVGWYVLLTIVIRGPELSKDLSELDAARRKIKTSIDFMKFVGHPIRKTQVNIVRELLLTSSAAGAREWGALVIRYDELSTGAVEEGPISPAQTDDDLAEWLGNLDISEDAPEENNDDACPHSGRRRWEKASTVEVGNHELYICSWCGNPSAGLRKCGGCGKTKYCSCWRKYCDGGCQKSHWSEHKVDCKGR